MNNTDLEALKKEVAEKINSSHFGRSIISETIDHLASIGAIAVWRPISEAKIGQKGLFYHPAWRNPFPGIVNIEDGCWIDTCEYAAKGRQEYPTHFMMPLLLPSHPDGGKG